MEQTIFARPKTNEQFVDMRERPVCPDGMIPMDGERPTTESIAQSDGSWSKISDRDKQAKAERAWAMSELIRTDRCFVPDYPITEEGRQQIKAYRQLLRNPKRSEHPDYPDITWRPTWPKEVKQPAS